jgi:FkbM family methyltransferase
MTAGPRNERAIQMLTKALPIAEKVAAKVLREAAVRAYKRYPPGHIFDVQAEDMPLKLTFLDYPLDIAIVERIEARREPETTAMMRALLRPGHKVLELGGCYGYFTSIQSRCVGPSGKIISIEGLPANFRILSENLRLNGADNVEPVNAFITSRADMVSFASDERSPYGAIDRLKAGQVIDGDAVPTIRISEFLAERGFDPDIVFMDIEGFEVELFEDLDTSCYFARHRPTFLFEIHEMFYERDRGLDWILQLLARSGYITRRAAGNILAFPA